jgi:hypothetical protein
MSQKIRPLVLCVGALAVVACLIGQFKITPRRKVLETSHITVTGIICALALAFIIFGHYYPGQIQAVLKEPIMTVPSAVLDWWSVTHMLFFAILAYLFPDHLFELFLLGIVWEIIEDGLSPRDSKGLVTCDKKYSNSWMETFKIMWCDNIAREKDYWYGKWDDVFSNLLGIVIGHFVRINT